METLEWKLSDNRIVKLFLEGDRLYYNIKMAGLPDIVREGVAIDPNWLENGNFKSYIRRSNFKQDFFEAYIPETSNQRKFRKNILRILNVQWNNFEVFVQPNDGVRRSPHEMQELAEAYDVRHNSRLGNPHHYILWLAWQIQNSWKTWQQVCDEFDNADADRILEKNGKLFFAGGSINVNVFPRAEFEVRSIHGIEHIKMENIVAFVVIDY